MIPPDVNYTVKELIARVEGKIDSIVATLSNKVDVSAVAAMELRIARLENSDAKQGAVDQYKKWLLASSLMSIAALSTIVGLLLHYAIH